MADRQLLIPEVRTPGRRLGRHIRHDPQSMRYLVAPKGATVVPRTVFHERRIPLLNQGDLGSCTCSSATGILGSAGFYETLPPDLARLLADPVAAQRWAEDLYREVTHDDPFPGAWEPEDTGSDGLSVAKVLHKRGLIAGYEHITSLEAAHAAIQRHTFFAGTMWFSGQSSPNSQGIVTATGQPLGGHQYQCFGYELERDLWWWWQTWGELFGVDGPVGGGVAGGGAFAMSSATFGTLLRQQGDATLLVPLTAPAPQPAPPEPPAEFPIDQVMPWLQGRVKYTKRERTAAAAITGWLESVTS